MKALEADIQHRRCQDVQQPSTESFT